MSVSHPSRQRRKSIYLAAKLIAFSLGAIGIYVSEAGSPFAFISALAVFAAIVLSFMWFRSLDELAQRAHFEAWYWGGTIGLLALPAASIALMLTGDQIDALEVFLRHVGAIDRETDFMMGIAVAVIPPMLGYGIWWIAFWLRKS